jgi:uncharacterized protein Yka (UPF0111/DUF47 family)
MAVRDSVSGPLLLVQQLQEHCGKVYEGVTLIEPLVDALLAQDYDRMRILHAQASQIADEADQLKLALYEQAKDVHFGSAGSYAFSRYVNSQNNIIGSTRDFADLLLARQITIPADLRAALGTFVAHVAGISGQMMSLAKGFSLPADSSDARSQDPLPAIANVVAGNRRTRQLEMEFGQRIHRHEGLDPVTVLALDRYSMALRKIADAAECAANHLCLLIPRSGVGA